MLRYESPYLLGHTGEVGRWTADEEQVSILGHIWIVVAAMNSRQVLARQIGLPCGDSEASLVEQTTFEEIIDHSSSNIATSYEANLKLEGGARL